MRFQTDAGLVRLEEMANAHTGPEAGDVSDEGNALERVD
jgi:hypothetical protein